MSLVNHSNRSQAIKTLDKKEKYCKVRKNQVVRNGNLIEMIYLYLCYFQFQVVKMLIIVVSLFAICWMPLHIYQVLSLTHPAINK